MDIMRRVQLSVPHASPLHAQVNKVAGNFHFAPGRSYQSGNMHVHDVAPFGDVQMDFSHTVHKLAFGKPYPGEHAPHLTLAPLHGVLLCTPQAGLPTTPLTRLRARP